MIKKIAFIQYTNPAAYPPLEHSSRILANNGWKVLFLGNGAAGLADKFRFSCQPGIKVICLKYKKPGWIQKIHFLYFCLWAPINAWWFGAKWIYASETLACPAALITKFVFGMRVVYHEHDSPDPRDSESLFNKFLFGCRRWLGLFSDLVVLPNSGRAELYRKETGRSGAIEVVWNVPSLEEARLIIGPKTNKIILFYHGSLNETRLPPSVLDALLELESSVELHFAGYSSGNVNNYGEWFIEEAGKRGLKDRVKYLGAFESRSQLLKICSEATIGLAFMPKVSDDRNMRNMAGASNKPFDYMACELNLLVSDLPDWNEMYVETGFARPCDPYDPNSIKNAIQWFVNNKEAGQSAVSSAKNKLIKEWNYEILFAKVLAILIV